MNVSFTKAEIADLSVLLPLTKEFYIEHPLEFNQERMQSGLSQLLENPDLGLAWIIKFESSTVGYLILTFGFSLEFAGRDAFIDEIYLRPEYRGRGLGEAAVAYAQEYAKASGITAIHLEVAKGKEQAIGLNEKMGFESREGNFLMSWSK